MLQPSHAFLGGLFKKTEDKKVLSAEQLGSQEAKATEMLGKAQGYENAGKKRQARDAYKNISNSYPRTNAGGEAKFGYARMLEAEGDGRKAFEEYQELITNHRNSPNFNEAVRHQYEIAEGYRKSEKKGLLGIGAPIQPSKLVEMFEQISESAPFTEYAPKSLLAIGYVKTEIGEMDPAIASFQKVVDKYPETETAKEAQYQIFKLRGVTAEKSNSPVKDRAQVEAGLDFVNQNPQDQRAAEVKSDLQTIEERSMEKLYNTGMFYEKSGKPDSARVYFREVVKNPNTSWASKARERLAILDGQANSVEKKAGMFGPNPLKRDKVEMRTSNDSVVPLPAEASAPSNAGSSGIAEIPSPPPAN
ncbi:MAG: tetratricopeptide repeat protein [Verrucomicrobiae bacterium]|nr:tetratricopeptide repeat protein [Verrucomicrobiae bacterium]